MALGNEVVAKNDPEEESKSVDDQIAEILAQRTETAETEVENTATQEDTPAENENTPTEVEDTPTEDEPSSIDEENTNINAAKEPEAEAEEEEEEDLIDPVEEVREKCEAKEACQKYLEKLEDCNNRVGSKSNTAETCHEEMMDWVHAVDHCVSHSLFSKIK
ncbi:cytochrome b-c1 complex subunit 6, mitochondrial-like isoform X2 [Mercenaria mercenaria]|uniref:cytochrome b-c1 complex subunit 6, mitochondrial-like isoform X2 n=1 Tax=Mercenaria mercenaria TaxID=6596 RepID=UPI00234F2022|nr:cytochrome b-c1 complex subunit 6, mitochondrial-like isoform X2 [Mercenaria mercenaria]